MKAGVSKKKEQINKKQYSHFLMQVAQDKRKMEKIQAERTEYLLITVQNYIFSLRLNSSSWDNDLVIFS